MRSILRFFRNSIRPWVCWISSKGLGVGLKFFGAKIETDAVSTDAGLVISALRLSSSSTAAAAAALAGCFRRDPDDRGRLDVFGALFAEVVASTASTIATGAEVVVVVTLTDAFLVVTSSAMKISTASFPSGACVCSSTNVKSSSTNVPAAIVRHAAAHKISKSFMTFVFLDKLFFECRQKMRKLAEGDVHLNVSDV